MEKKSIAPSMWIALLFGGLLVLMACSEETGKTVNVKSTKSNGIAVSIGTGDAFQEELILKNSKTKDDLTNTVEQQNGIAVSVGRGKSVQASIVIE